MLVEQLGQTKEILLADIVRLGIRDNAVIFTRFVGWALLDPRLWNKSQIEIGGD